MSKRSLKYTLAQTKVWLPALFGLGLLIGKFSLFWGLGFVAFALWQGSRLLGNSQLDDLLRLREQKHQHRINRLLNDRERREIIAIDHYAEQLRRKGADLSLGESAMHDAWEIIRAAGPKDASVELARYRQTLPALEGSQVKARPEVAAKIERELHILHATQKEMDSLQIDEPEILMERTPA